MRRRKQCKTML